MVKCNAWDREKEEYCKKKGVSNYCADHNREAYIKTKKLEIKLSNRNHLLLVILLVPLALGLLVLSMSYSNKYNEDALCQIKVLEYFPEYEFDKIFYYGTTTKGYICHGKYSDKKGEIIRDGLKMWSGEGILAETVIFELIDEKDKQYVDADDWTSHTFTGAIIIGIILLIVVADWNRNKEWWI